MMMEDTFRIRRMSEDDIRSIVEKCGGSLAHPDANRRKARGADFIVGGAAIELKMLDDNGFEKTERQEKLARIFKESGTKAPVVVLDPERLSAEGRRQYDRAIEGPIKTAISSARKQLKQTRSEKSGTTLSVLWVVNNGYTALNHDELTAMVAHRVRNDTTSIDGVIVGGCYFHSDGFDSFFLWPLVYIPLSLKSFSGFEALRTEWNRYANDFMTQVVTGNFDGDPFKGPVVDTEFEIDGTTFVKPAPPIGQDSEFFKSGRPRKNSTGINVCPPVALTFPGLTKSEWGRFREEFASEPEFRENYEAWLRHEEEARDEGTLKQPFVRIPISFDGWKVWNAQPDQRFGAGSIYEYANRLFQDQVQKTIAAAREMKEGAVIPSCYVLAITDEIGMDKGNDVSRIAKVREFVDGNQAIIPLATDLRIFHEHAIALASAYAVNLGYDAVMWNRDRRYAWV